MHCKTHHTHTLRPDARFLLQRKGRYKNNKGILVKTNHVIAPTQEHVQI
jgi:hypothetical protein